MKIDIKWIRPGRHMGGQYRARALVPIGLRDDGLREGIVAYGDEVDVDGKTHRIAATAYARTEDDAKAKLAARLLGLDKSE